jgi:hypothetical protein
MKRSKLKNASMLIIMSGLLASCASTYETIGNASILSDRSLRHGIVYEQLTVNSGGSRKEIKSSKTESVDGAVKQLIAKVPGGCFITDVTIYIVDDGRYAVSGNVWGIPVSGLKSSTSSALAVSNATYNLRRSLNSK